ARALHPGQRLLHRLTDPQARAQLPQLLALRRQLAAAVLTPADGRQPPGRPEQLQALTRRREELEKELARAVPELARQQARDRSTPADLARALPEGSTFLDLYRYHTWDAKQFRWGEAHYAAFVLAPNQKPRRVELGAAKPIEAALAAGRQAIAEGLDSDAATPLRRLVWDPLALPQGTRTVYVCPDALLSALPWGALPGAKPGTVLLEECAVAL